MFTGEYFNVCFILYSVFQENIKKSSSLIFPCVFRAYISETDREE